jgi:acyl dehydratase/NAD(P)-dependent dehydrogenase (short-subunit alcohol dehydrogenase family)
MIASTRIFTIADQENFARLSGDWNPMHMDPIAARRTLAGAPVVHGVHAALWALNELVQQDVVHASVASVAAQFARFVYLDRPVGLEVTARDNAAVRAVIRSDGVQTSTLTVKLGSPEPLSGTAPELPVARTEGAEPNVLSLQDMAGLAGWLRPQASVTELQAMFPAACRCVGADRIGEIALMSRLVGMICPGLHSIFGAFAVNLAGYETKPGLGFQVTLADQRFRRVQMKVAGSAIAGTVTTQARLPPVEQATMGHVRASVDPREFAGQTALVIGGSRGLGALTAKIIAAGGGKVLATYAVGREDAERLASDITTHMGPDACRVLPFNTSLPAASQLASVEGPVSHVYHFASPRILRQSAARFSPDLFQAFVRAYVMSFAEICEYLSSRDAAPLVAFYPSSVYVAGDRPSDMTEYAMAKAAGEVLCSELNRPPQEIRVIAQRLPRLLTDQTAALTHIDVPDALETMLPLIREVQSVVA